MKILRFQQILSTKRPFIYTKRHPFGNIWCSTPKKLVLAIRFNVFICYLCKLNHYILLYLQRKFILVYKQTQQKTKIMRQKKMIIAALAAMLLAAGDKEKSNAMTICIPRQQW